MSLSAIIDILQSLVILYLLHEVRFFKKAVHELAESVLKTVKKVFPDNGD